MRKTDSETFANPVVPSFPADRLLAYRVAREVLAEVARVSRGWRGRASLRAQALDRLVRSGIGVGVGIGIGFRLGVGVGVGVGFGYQSRVPGESMEKGAPRS